MENSIDSETNVCTFLWIIENFPFWLKVGEVISSPTFITWNSLENTKWSLRLYPAGEESESFVSLFLRREHDCRGPDTIKINYRLAILDKDGSFLTEKTSLERSFTKGTSKGNQKFELREKITITEKESFLTDNTLRVQCKLMKKDDKPALAQNLTACTVLKVNRVSYVWKIDKFSFHKSSLRNKVNDKLIVFDLILNNGIDFEKKISVDVLSLDKSIKYFLLKASIIDFEGKKENIVNYEYSGDDLKKGILCASLFTKNLMANKSRYLPNDALSLFIEYVTTDGNVLTEIFTDGFVYPIAANVAVKNSEEDLCQAVVKNICDEKEKPQHVPVLVDDLKTMYDEKIFCDTELCTPTKTFQAHKSILSARSPVFMSMLTNDMKERNSGIININDLEDETVCRMLKYLYTDSLQDIQLDSACKLYVAADKYDILSMKKRCSSFLKENLSPTKACDVLELADLHQDDDLKNSVQDYILNHDRDVFGSQEWKNFMDTNSKLAVSIMYRKVFPT